jgi:hypothetical protein
MSHVDEGLLHAYLDGAIRPGDDAHAALTAHLELCADCRARLEEARAIKDRAHELLRSVLAGGKGRPDFAEVERLAAARLQQAEPAADTEPAANTNRPARARRSRRYVSLAWAASIGVAVGAGWMARALIVVPEVDEPRAAATDVPIRATEPAAAATSPVESEAVAAAVESAAAAGSVESSVSVPAPAATLPPASPPVADATTPRAEPPVAAMLPAAPPTADSAADAVPPADRLAAAPTATVIAPEVEAPTPMLTVETSRLARAPAAPSQQIVARDVVARTGFVADAQNRAAADAVRRGVVADVAPPRSPRDSVEVDPRATPVAGAAGGTVLSRLFGGARVAATTPGRWREIGAHTAAQRYGHPLVGVPGLAIAGVWAAEESGALTIRTVQRGEDGTELEILQWHDGLPSRVDEAADTYAVVVRTTERTDGTNVVFVDLRDGGYASLRATLPLVTLVEIAAGVRPLDVR